MITSSQPTNILIIGPAWVGDMIIAQSLFKVLKQRYPHASIDVIAPDWSLPLLAMMPEINQAMSLPIGHSQLKLKARYTLAKKLRAISYDQAIVLPNSWKSALIPFWAGIPKRIGWLGECRWGLLNDARKLDKSHYPLMVQRFIALGLPGNATAAQDYPSPQLVISSEELKNTKHKFNLSHIDQPVLALCPGAEFGSSKRWPIAYYAELALKKIQQGFAVWLLGSAKDNAVAQQINQLTQAQCTNFAGKTELVEAAHLLKLATVVVSNDSGLMHIAAALDKPLVTLFGSSSPAFTPPLSDNAHILRTGIECSPCFQRECPLKHHRCMKDLTVERVITELDRLK